MSESEHGRGVSFGVFEVDLRSGELRKHGIKVKLQEQPFQVLTLLLAANGEIVTREELRAQLWPADTFVDFDTGLNTAVKRLRDALGDSAESPRYVETLPRKGYRFIYPIDVAQKAVENSGSGTAKPVANPQPLWRQQVRIVVPALALVTISVALAGFRYLRSRPALTDKDIIVLADFENRTGEPVFDKTLREALKVDLDQSPFFNVMPDIRITQVLEHMMRPPGDTVTNQVGREICLRTSSKAVLTGSIATLGSHYALQISAADCQTGNTLAAISAEAETRERVLQTLGKAATTLRSKLGESMASVQRYDKPLEEATTSSLEALQAYTEGDRVFRQKGLTEAVPFFERAIQLDPKFASAYCYLGAIYSNTVQKTLQDKNLTTCFKLSDRLGGKERYMSVGLYYQDVTGEIGKAAQQFQLVAQEYPRDFWSRENLAGIHVLSGELEQGANALREAISLQPDNSVGYGNLTLTLMALERPDEAQAVLDEAFSRKLDTPFLHEQQYFLAFLRNDAAAMQRELQWAMGKPVVESWALSAEASTQAYYGRRTKAQQIARAAVMGALRDDARVPAAQMQAWQAIADANIHNTTQARQGAHAALALSQDRHTRFLAAIALARAGDSNGAQREVDALNREHPVDTLLQHYWLPAIRAQIELNHGRFGRALELLETARPYELNVALGPGMYSASVRGHAYLAAGNGAAAAAEFQNILHHRGLASSALAHLYLGRAHALEASSLNGPAAEDAKRNASAAYLDFLTLWKDADADIPILKQAKAEYAKLQ